MLLYVLKGRYQEAPNIQFINVICYYSNGAFNKYVDLSEKHCITTKIIFNFSKKLSKITTIKCIWCEIRMSRVHNFIIKVFKLGYQNTMIGNKRHLPCEASWVLIPNHVENQFNLGPKNAFKETFRPFVTLRYHERSHFGFSTAVAHHSALWS